MPCYSQQGSTGTCCNFFCQLFLAGFRHQAEQALNAAGGVQNIMKKDPFDRKTACTREAGVL